MFTQNDKAGVKMTTCEEVGAMQSGYSIDITGWWIHHSGQEVWIRLAGCGESDSHTFKHHHDAPVYMNRMYQGKMVRITAERSWNPIHRVWNWAVSIHSVNGTNC